MGCFIESVKASNGKESILYNNLLQLYSPSDAMRVYLNVGSTDLDFESDANGEPAVSNIEEYPVFYSNSTRAIYPVDNFSDKTVDVVENLLKAGMDNYDLRVLYKSLRDGAVGYLNNVQRKIVVDEASAIEGTVYHEVFEAVWKNYVPTDVQNQMLKELRSRPNYGEDSRYIELERLYGNNANLDKEYLAEEFREYVISNENSRGATIKKWFKKLLNYLRSILNFDKEMGINTLYDTIYTGGYSNTQPISNRDGAIEYSRMKDSVGNEISVKADDDLTNALTLDMYDHMLSGLSPLKFTKTNVIDAFKSVRSKYVDLLTARTKAISAFEAGDKQVAAEIKQFYIDKYGVDISNGKVMSQYNIIGRNFKLAVSNVVDKLVLRGIKMNIASTAFDTEDYVDSWERSKQLATLDEGSEAYDESNVKSKDSLGERNQLEFSAKDGMSESIRIIVDSLYNIDLERKEGELLRRRKVDFDKVFATLINRLYDKSYSEMKEELNLIHAENIRQDKGQVWAKQLIEVLTKSYSDSRTSMDLAIAFEQTFKKTYYNQTKLIIGKEGEVKLINANADTVRKRVSDRIKEYSIQTESDPNNFYRRNESNKIIFDLIRFKTSAIPNSEEGVIKFLKNVGIPLEKAGILTASDYESLKMFLRLAKKEAKSIDEGIEFSSILDIPNLVGASNKALDIIAKSMDIKAELQFISADSKTNYAVSDQTWISQTFDAINKVDNVADLIAENSMFNNPFVRNNRSIFLADKFIRTNSEDMSWSVMNGLDAESSSSGKVTKKLALVDRILQDIHTMYPSFDESRSMIPSFQHGDKSINYAFRMGSLPFYKRHANAKSILDKVGQNYFMHEVDLILDYFHNEDYYQDISGYDKQGGMFRFFDFVNESTKKAILSQIKDQANNAVTLDLAREVLYPLYSEHLDSITNDLSNMIDSEVEFLTSQNVHKFLDPKLVKEFGGDVPILTNYVANKYVGLYEFSNLIYGDMAYFKAGNFFKRSSANASAKLFPTTNEDVLKYMDSRADKGEIGFRIDGRKRVGSDNLNVIVIKDFEFNHDYYGKVTESDGQSFISLDAYKELLYRIGEFKPEIEAIHNKLVDQRLFLMDNPDRELPKRLEVTSEEMGSYRATNLKTQYSSLEHVKINGEVMTDTPKPIFFKHSVAVDIPQAYQGTNLDDVFNHMYKNGTDLVNFISSDKVAPSFVESYYDDEGNLTLPESPMVHNLPFKHFGLQVKLPMKIKDKLSMGTQQNKLKWIDSYKDGEAYKEVFNDKISDYTKAMDDLIQIGVSEFASALDIKSESGQYVINNPKGLIDKLKAQALARNSPQNIMVAIDQLADTQLVDASIVKNKVEPIILSMAEKDILDLKFPGESYIQQAPTFLELKGSTRSGASQLKFYEKQGDRVLPAQVMIPVTPNLKPLLKDNLLYRMSLEGYEHGSYQTELDHLNDMTKYVNEVFRSDANLDDYPNVMDFAKAISAYGFRIPTQGINSIDSVMVAKFLPEVMGNTAITPSEIVSKSGSDYDVDKLNLIRMQFSIADVDGQVSISFPKEGKDALYNQTTEISISLLADQSNYDKLIEPDTVDDIKAIANQLKPSGGSYKLNAPLLPSSNFKAFQAFYGGKDGIGIVALQLPSHALAQVGNWFMKPFTYYNKIYKVKSKLDVSPDQVILETNTIEVNGEKVISLAGEYDVENKHRISKILREFLSAFVDVVKDPFAFDMGLNTQTATVFSTMIRMGIPIKRAALFMSQPIISDYLNRLSYERSVSKMSLETVSSKKILKSTRDSYPETTEGVDLKKAFNDDALLESIIKGTSTVEMQRDVLDLYIQLDAMATNMSSMITSYAVDTKRFGAKYADVVGLEKQKDYLEQSNVIGNFYESIKKGSVLNPFYKAYDQVFSYIKSLSLTSHSNFKEAYNNLLDSHNSDGAFSRMDLTNLAGMLSNDLASAVVQYGVEYKGNPMGSYFNDMFLGNNSMAKRWIGLIAKYPALKESTLGRELYALVNYRKTGVDNIRFYNRKLSVIDSNILVDSFQSMFEQGKDVADFFKDLMVFSLIQSGYNNSFLSIRDLIPAASWGALVNEGFKDFKKNGGSFTTEQFLDSFIFNNANNSKMPASMYFEPNVKGVRAGKGFGDYQANPYSKEQKVLNENASYETSSRFRLDVPSSNTSIDIVREPSIPQDEYETIPGLRKLVDQTNLKPTEPEYRQIEHFYGKMFKRGKSPIKVHRLADKIREMRMGESIDPTMESTKPSKDMAKSRVKFYEGNITPSQNTVFVFGRNPENRHGAGAASVAKSQFGLKQSESNSLNAYGIITKDLMGYGNFDKTKLKVYPFGNLYYIADGAEFRADVVIYNGVTYNKIDDGTTANGYIKGGLIRKSSQFERESAESKWLTKLPKEFIEVKIAEMYEEARNNPNKNFMVAYNSDVKLRSLNGYTGLEMIEMFKNAGEIPSNVIFSKKWVDTRAFEGSTLSSRIQSLSETQLDQSKVKTITDSLAFTANPSDGDIQNAIKQLENIC